MTVELFANLAKTTLNGAINNSTTSITPTSTAGFSTPGGGKQFRITIDSEIMIVTAVTTGVWTVTRGAEGTTASAHANLANIYQTITAASLAAIPIASGDLTGTVTTATVAQIQGQPVSNSSVTKGQVFVGTSAGNYGPVSVSGDTSWSTGTPGAVTVTGLQGQPLSASAVTEGQFLLGTTNGHYGPVSLSTDIAGSTSTPGSLTVTQITGAAGTVSMLANQTWTAGSSAPTLSQTAAASDVATVSFNVTPQPPYASAVTNVTGGSYNVNLAAPIGAITTSTPEAAFVVKRAGSAVMQVQTVPGTAATTAVYLTKGVSPSATNWSLLNDGTNFLFNAPGGAVYFQVSNGTIFTGTTSGLNMYHSQLYWQSSVNGPTIMQTAQALSATPVAGYTMSMVGQTGQGATGSNISGGAGAQVTIAGGIGGVSTGSANNAAGGAVTINGGVAGTGGTGATGSAGSVIFQVGGNTVTGLSASGPTTTIHSLTVATTGTTTLAATDYLYEYQYIAPVTLAGNIVVQFPNAAGRRWLLDVSQVTWGIYGITVQCGSGATTTFLSSTSSKFLWIVACPAANTCVIG